MPALGLESASRATPRSLRVDAWLWSPRRDLSVFGGSAALALAVVALGHVLGFGGGALPEWGFLLFVLGVDVAHVYATLFRTYFDAGELRARPLRYVLVPLAAYALGAAAYAAGPELFWRALAYLALFHFVRQEIGWLRVQRAKAKPARFDARLDELALYVSTLYPLAVWHAAPAGRHFSWFVLGDFVALPALTAVLPALSAAALAVLALFVARQLWLAMDRGVLRPLPCLIIGKTALIWYVGIVYCNSDFDFTVTNVLAHGVPYFALLFGYARAQAEVRPAALGSRLIAGGLAAFVAVLLGLAALEEWSWDFFVNHEHAPWFGHGPELAPAALGLLVPLLAVPQLTHYVLDARLWRSAEARRLPALQRALGTTTREETR